MALTNILLSCLTDSGFWVVFLLVFTVLLYLRSRSSQSSAPLPPGPPVYPMIGSYLSLRDTPNPLEAMINLAEKYGNVTFGKLFSTPVVVIKGYETVHEALVKDPVMSSCRFDLLGSVEALFDFGKGLIWNSGECQQALRKFALKGMRELGVGRQGVEEKVQEEVAAFVALLDKQQGQPVDFRTLMMKASNNVICSVCFGRRFEYDDPKMAELLEILANMFKPQPILAQMVSVFPWLRFLSPFRKAQAEGLKGIEAIFAFVRERIKEREGNFDGQVIRDFVDLYHSRVQDEAEHLNEKNLLGVITDLFGAGSETTATSVSWHLVYMLHYPQVMKQCQEQIDKVVGRSRPVTMADKAALPFVEATMLEVLRMSNTALTTLPHGNPNGGEFQGYRIPAGSMVVVDLRSVHMQPDLWENPDRFHPPRFIQDDGSINRKLPLVAFGMGPRQCAGELLAKQELFLFFAGLLQCFDILPASTELPSCKGILGIANSPQPFEVRLVAR